jgi:hypothetical protein
MTCGPLQQLAEAVISARRQLEIVQDGGPGGGPVGAGDQEALGVGVAAAAVHPDLAGTQRAAQLRQQDSSQ